MSTSHKEKIIRVLQLFQTTDEKTPMNAVQISQKLEEEYGMENVHRTSIYDDVRLLQSCGYPIKQAENSHKGWYMEKHLLEDWEIKLMLDSVQQARCVSVHEANEIRKKLLNLTSQRGRSRFSHMIMPLPGNVRGAGRIGEYIEIMLEAMYLHKKIRFQYTEINNARLIAQYDPYLEDSFTLWIMHSYIAKNEEFATTWFMYFNRCDAEELEKSEVVTILSREIKKYVNGGSFSEKSLSNDVDVLLNMYSRNKEKLNPEDKNISPFSHLALIKKLDGKYVKCHPSKRIFPEEVVLYELSLRLIGNEGISIEEVLFGEKGIVKIYNLSSVMANDYLDRLDTAGYIRVDRTAGLDMIYPVRELNPRNIIEDFYENN